MLWSLEEKFFSASTSLKRQGIACFLAVGKTSNMSKAGSWRPLSFPLNQKICPRSQNLGNKLIHFFHSEKENPSSWWNARSYSSDETHFSSPPFLYLACGFHEKSGAGEALKDNSAKVLRWEHWPCICFVNLVSFTMEGCKKGPREFTQLQF